VKARAKHKGPSKLVSLSHDHGQLPLGSEPPPKILFFLWDLLWDSPTHAGQKNNNQLKAAADCIRRSTNNVGHEGGGGSGDSGGSDSVDLGIGSGEDGSDDSDGNSDGDSDSGNDNSNSSPHSRPAGKNRVPNEAQGLPLPTSAPSPPPLLPQQPPPLPVRRRRRFHCSFMCIT
jgi:hypothetical protein